MTKLGAGLTTSLPASDPGSTAAWNSKRINPQLQSCLCLTWSNAFPNDDDDEKPAPTTIYLSVVVQSPSLHWRGLKWLVNSPRVSSSGDSLADNLSLCFCPCCPMRGHIWTAFLNSNDHPPISCTVCPTTFFSLFSHPKPPLYLCD